MTIICPLTRERALAPTKRDWLSRCQLSSALPVNYVASLTCFPTKVPSGCKHEEMIIFRTGGQPFLFHVSFSFVSKIDDDDEEMI